VLGLGLGLVSALRIFMRPVYGVVVLPLDLYSTPFVTLPPDKSAKYCDERVCLSVCLSARIS